MSATEKLIADVKATLAEHFDNDFDEVPYQLAYEWLVALVAALEQAEAALQSVGHKLNPCQCAEYTGEVVICKTCLGHTLGNTQLDKLEAEVARLRAALEQAEVQVARLRVLARYARHDDDCTPALRGGKGCRCGFADAIIGLLETR